MSKLLIWNKNHIPTSKITRFRSLNKTKKVIQIYKKKKTVYLSHFNIYVIYLYLIIILKTLNQMIYFKAPKKYNYFLFIIYEKKRRE